jgi:hypothetical protein
MPADLADVQQRVAEMVEQALAVAGVILRLRRAARDHLAVDLVGVIGNGAEIGTIIAGKAIITTPPKFWGPPPAAGCGAAGREAIESPDSIRLAISLSISLISTPSKGKDTRTRARRAPLGAVLIGALRAPARSPDHYGHLSASRRPLDHVVKILAAGRKADAHDAAGRSAHGAAPGAFHRLRCQERIGVAVA